MEEKTQNEPSELSREVASKAARKLKAQKRGKLSILGGVSVFGLVGWSVVIPSLLGAALGIWLDKRYPGEHSWTLTLLLGGIVLGCLNAWYWVDKEDKAIHKDLEDDE
ncbi:MAG: AtpZ/AtpI family protein [Saprospiraceae bacterium]